MGPPRGRFGHYELRGPLGVGGGGTVLRAWDPLLQREVALKLLSAPDPGPAAQAARERFRREAEALARLRHPGIVRVHSAGEEHGRPYLVLDLVPGHDLQHLLDTSGPLPPQKAADLVRQVALAVEHAHQAGILHRDLKPANVLLDEQGRPLLTDFGLAGDLEASLGASRLTKDGRFLGTPGFWAPEQALGQVDRIGPGADVYGLGALLYAVLTGEPPHTGGSLPELLAAVQRPARPPRALRPEVPPQLDELCQRCLQRDPRDRPATAAALAEELGRFLADEPLTPRPPRRGQRGRVAALVVIAAAGALAWRREAGAPPPAPREQPSAAPSRGAAAQTGARGPDPAPAPWQAWVDLSPARLREAEAAWPDVLLPLALRLDDDALLLRGVGPSHPCLDWPLPELKGPFRLSAELELRCLDGSPLTIALFSGDQPALTLTLHRDPQDGPELGATAKLGAGRRTFDLPPLRVAPRVPLTLVLSGEPGRRVALQLSAAGRSLGSVEADCPGALDRLVVTLGGPGSAWDGWALVALRRLRLELELPLPRTPRPLPPPLPWIRMLRFAPLPSRCWVLGQEPLEFARAYDSSGPEATAAIDLYLLRSLADARAGQEERALDRMIQLCTNSDPKWVRRWIAASLSGLDPADRRVLARLVAHYHKFSVTPEQLESLAQQLTAGALAPGAEPTLDLAEAALLFPLLPPPRNPGWLEQIAALEAAVWGGLPDRLPPQTQLLLEAHPHEARPLVALAAARRGDLDGARAALSGPAPEPRRILAVNALRRVRALLGR